MSPTSAAEYSSPNEAKKIGLLKEIRDNWIRAYISINGEPKFTEIPKSEKEEKAVLDADSALGKAMKVLASFKGGTKTEL
jgi:hypothetical protein